MDWTDWLLVAVWIVGLRFAFYFGKAAGLDQARKGHTVPVSLVLELNGDPVAGRIEITGCRPTAAPEEGEH